MIDAIDRIERYMEDIDLPSFEKDDQLQSAVLFQFIVIGEAIRHIDPMILERHPFPWHQPRGFRNFIAHQYNLILPERVFHTTKELQDLRSVLERIQRSEFENR